MTSLSLASWALETGLAITLLIGIILLIRRSFAKHFGACAAYALWLLPVVRMCLPPIILPVLKPLPKATIDNALISEPYLFTSTDITAITLTASHNWAELVIGLWLSVAVVWVLREVFRQYTYTQDLIECSTALKPSMDSIVLRAFKTAQLSTLPDIRISQTQTGPLVTGLFKPLIILPKNFQTHFDTQQQYFSLLHEMMHIKRKDIWAAGGMIMFRAVNWPNPLIHFAAQKFRIDQEAACDASVLKKIGTRGQTHDYAQTLIHAAHIAVHPKQAAPLGLTIYHPLKERLMMMTHKRPPTSHKARLSAGAVILAAAALTAPITLASGPSEPEMAGAHETTSTAKKVIKWVQDTNGVKTEKHYEILEKDGVTKAYSVAADGSKTEVDIESIDIKGQVDMLNMGDMGEDMSVFVLKDGDVDNVKKKIRIITQNGQHSEHDIETLIGERGEARSVFIKKLKDGDIDVDTNVKVFKFSSSDDIDFQFDSNSHMIGGSHTSAMVTAASGLLDGVDASELSDKTRRKLEKARKALKEAQNAIDAETEK